MALVLAIEPDHRQATILKRMVKEKIRADVVVVDSPDAALSAIRAHVPDVLLLSALLSPRDEDELIAHLRSLDGADHIQTHTIPQLASTGAYQDDQGRKGRGLLGVFKRGKKEADAPVPGCDPELFADEILAFIQRAAERKAEGVAALQSRVDRLEYEVQQSAATASTAAPAGRSHETPADASGDAAGSSSWSSPFEWRPSAQPQSMEPDQRARQEDAMAARPVEPDAQATEPAAVAALEPIETPPYVYQEPRAAEQAAVETPIDVRPAHREEAAAAPPVEQPRAPEPVVARREEPKPVAAAPAPTTRRRRSSGSLTPETVLRLTPLAMWARSEGTGPGTNGKPVHEPKTATDELRSLMATLAVPAHVAGVSYGRGCRIRRVRVPGGKERRAGDTSGPVILSKRALEEQRSEANR